MTDYLYGITQDQFDELCTNMRDFVDEEPDSVIQAAMSSWIEYMLEQLLEGPVGAQLHESVWRRALDKYMERYQEVRRQDRYYERFDEKFHMER